jgi:hypothetical protein
MDEATHKNSFAMQGIKYYDCFQATALWLNDASAHNEIEMVSSSDDALTKSFVFGGESILDIDSPLYQTCTSI